VNLRTQIIKLKPFQGSKNYWEKRYSAGGNSGVGSYGQFAEFKAEVINNFVAKCGLRSVIEFGCGDGNQLTLAKYPTYLGFDVSKTSVLKCQKLFSGNGSKFFRLMADYRGEKADVSLSLDVIYHLVEDDIFENYMMTLFNSSNKYVIIYASDSNNNLEQKDEHVRHRKFTVWIKKNIPQWRLIEHIPNKYPYKGDYKKGSFSDFFIYTKV
jgi:hypothetical protein